MLSVFLFRCLSSLFFLVVTLLFLHNNTIDLVSFFLHFFVFLRTKDTSHFCLFSVHTVRARVCAFFFNLSRFLCDSMCKSVRQRALRVRERRERQVAAVAVQATVEVVRAAVEAVRAAVEVEVEVVVMVVVRAAVEVEVEVVVMVVVRAAVEVVRAAVVVVVVAISMSPQSWLAAFSVGLILISGAYATLTDSVSAVPVSFQRC